MQEQTENNVVKVDEMVEVLFEGYSDDGFSANSIHYDNCANGCAIQFELRAPDNKGGIRVTGCYGTLAKKTEDYGCNHMPMLGCSGCWMIGVEQLDESELVDWSASFDLAGNRYRNRLKIVAPKGALLVCLNSGENKTL